MSQEGQEKKIDFDIHKDDLYREENFTDLKVGALRRLIPVKADVTEDMDRKEMFIGHSQLMSPDGPLPIQVQIEVETFEEALNAFPSAMQKGLTDLFERYEKNRQEQQAKQGEESRIITP